MAWTKSLAAGGIFAGTAEIIEDQIGVHPYPGVATLNGARMVQDLYEQTYLNAERAMKSGHSGPSHSNWMWRKEIHYTTQSIETVLECRIVFLTTDSWANQIPVADELTTIDEGNRNIDLGFRVAAHSYDLIELKVASNDPVYAAMQILRYGLVYALYRRAENLLRFRYMEKPILNSRIVGLSVLAPQPFYAGLVLGELGSSAE